MRPAVFLDLDSTLLDHSRSREALITTCQQAAASVPGLDPDDLLKANGAVWPRYRAEIDADWNLGQIDSLTASREAWRRSLALCGCTSRTVVETTVHCFEQAVRQGFRLYADVPDAIAILQQADVPLALITNGPSDLQRSKLEILGIEHWFAAIIISGEWGQAKPDPAVFVRAMKEMGLVPDRVWHVGDSLETDIAGARAAGLSAVWLNRTRKSRDRNDPVPHCEIGTLGALPAILKLR